MEQNIDLSKYSKFAVGGKAEYLFTPNTIEELVDFIKNKKYIAPLNIVGVGSNILFKDELIKGTVISTKNLNKVELKDDFICAECGVLNSKLFNFAKNNNFGGFEFLGCIPGTIGGSCRMNAGCYGREMKDVVFDVEVLDFDGNVKVYNLEQCGFGYRTSLLENNLIVLSVRFKTETFEDKTIIEENFKKMIEEKIKSQPINERTCGSTFKNLPNMPAWKVIKELGLQDVDFNGVKFSEKHANFLVNVSSNSANDIINLINLTKNRAKKELNIDLELEIQIIENIKGTTDNE